MKLKRIRQISLQKLKELQKNVHYYFPNNLLSVTNGLSLSYGH